MAVSADEGLSPESVTRLAIGVRAGIPISESISRECSNNEVTKGGFSASNIDDTLDWRIDSML